MPIYEFRCDNDKCGKVEDRLVKFSEVDDQTCNCDTKSPMSRTDNIQSTNFALKGSWFKTTGSY